MAHSKRKPRFVTIEVNFKNGPYPDTLTVKSINDNVEFKDNKETIVPKSSSVEWSYARTNKDKTIRKYPTKTSDIRLDPNYSLMNSDTIYVIDTNTDYKSNLSVSCILRGKPKYDVNGTKVGIQFLSLPYLIVKKELKYPERSAWCQLIENTISISDGATLLIVDSDLNNLELYNSREKPILGKCYLPKNVTILYASADVGKENIVNKVMSQTDKAASRMSKRILSGEVIV